MSDDNKQNNKERKSGDVKVPPRNWLIWTLILVAIPVVIFFRTKTERAYPTISRTDLQHYLKDPTLKMDGKIYYAPPQSSMLSEISGRVINTNGQELLNFRAKTRLTDDLEKALLDRGFQEAEPNTLLMSIFVTVLPILLVAFLVYFFFIRQIKMAGKGALSFGKSKARLLSKEKNRTTFKDVAGVDEAKEEVSELVEFLKDPKKFQKLGGRIPKGILMIGAPGTGKTLLAKAIAGEADASFFSISGSDFVEMFVGVGASRVRDMFEQARKNTPC